MKRRIAFALSAWVVGTTSLVAQDNAPSVIGNDQIVLSSGSTFETNAPTAAITGNGCSTTFADATANYNTRSGFRFFGSIDYLLFNFRDGPAPPIIQHVPTGQFPPDGRQLDPNAARTLYGDSIRQHAFNGFNVMIGSYVNDSWGWDASYTEFETKNKSFFITSPGDPSIGRYYFDLTNSSQPNTYLVYSNPNGTVDGFIDVQAPTRLWWADVNIRCHGTAVFADQVDWLFGFRYIDLREGLFITDFTQFNQVGTGFLAAERFYTTNQFYGPQIGVRSWTNLGCGFCLDAYFKFAMGGVRQTAQIYGSTTELNNGVPVNRVVGDVLAQPTNVGERDRGFFAVVPELAVKLGYQVTSSVSVNIGYNLIAVSNVIRPGSIIDHGVNPNVNPYLIAGSNNTTQRPGFSFGGTDFWAQGLTLGFALRY